MLSYCLLVDLLNKDCVLFVQSIYCNSWILLQVKKFLYSQKPKIFTSVIWVPYLKAVLQNKCQYMSEKAAMAYIMIQFILSLDSISQKLPVFVF